MNTSLEKSLLNHISECVVGVAEWETGNWGELENKKTSWIMVRSALGSI